MKNKSCFAVLLGLAIGGTVQAATSARTPVRGAVRAPVVSPPVFGDPLTLDNPFMPFAVGGVKVFTGVSDRQKVVVVDLYTATTRTFNVNGTPVPTRMLQETEFESGEVVEISYNYFAQANDGTVYYFGEVVDIYEDGEIVSHDGSWLVGGAADPGDPAEAGNASAPAVFMPANPEPGDSFKPEDVAPIADETVTVLHTGRRLVVPAGRYEDVMQVRETSSLSPGAGLKWYAPGVGVIQDRSPGELLKLIAATFTP